MKKKQIIYRQLLIMLLINNEARKRKSVLNEYLKIKSNQRAADKNKKMFLSKSSPFYISQNLKYFKNLE